MNNSIIQLDELNGDYKKLIRSELSKIIDLSQFGRDSRSSTNKNLYEERDALRRAAGVHSWTRATVSSIARSAVGGGFSIVRHPVFGRIIPDEISEDEIWEQLEDVYNFFFGVKEEYTHIQDINSLSQKMYYTVTSFFLYGQAAWQLRRDESGKLTDFDVLAGVVFPNIDDDGRFLRPAYQFRPWNSSEIYDFNDPNDILYITWPGVDFSVYGNTEYTSVAESAIPSDLYAAKAYKSHFENMNAPYNGVWVVDQNTSDEDFHAFLQLLVARYTGVNNWGRNPLVIKGQAEFKETRSRSNDDAPYLLGRQYNQEEISAVTGVSGVKLGLAGQATKSNYREQRREFHETTLRPIFEMIEQAVYQQVFVRNFKLKGWTMLFNKPDFTNALEDATIYARYVGNSIMTPNEARGKLGYPQRTDEYGDVYYQPSNSIIVGESEVAVAAENQTAETEEVPEGGSERQTDPEDIPSKDKPTVAEEKTIDIDYDEVIEELKTWKRFAMRVADGTRSARKFETKAVPKEVASQIESLIEGKSKQEVSEIFKELIIG